MHVISVNQLDTDFQCSLYIIRHIKVFTRPFHVLSN